MNFDMIRKKEDFKKIYTRGKSFANKKLVIYYMKNNTEDLKIGISISRKVGKAVVRNHLRRLIKENIRLMKDLKSGYNVIFLARIGSDDLDYYSMRNSIRHILKKTDMLM